MTGADRLTARPGVRAAAALLLFVVAAVYFVYGELHRPSLAPAFDVYVYFLPNKLHAVRSLLGGGDGLLWNPYQGCGEPFFANTAMGLLYPLHLLFLVLEPNTAVHVVLILNMVICAAGMLLLCREMGLGWAASVGGAIALELGDPMAQLTGWSPMQSGPWAWAPWALFLCERLLRVPTLRGAVALGAVLALELLPGWVLITALTYQVIALRVVWEMVTVRRIAVLRSAAAIALGLALAPALAAVQLLPATELANQSFRVAIEFKEFVTTGAAMPHVMDSIRKRSPPLPFLMVPLVLAALAPLTPGHRRLTAFYLLVGAMYALLALGTATPLFSLYVQLPPGAAILRYPVRLFWICGLALAVLAAVGIETLSNRLRSVGTGPVLLAAGAAAAVLVALVGPSGVRWSEALALTLLVAAVLAVTRPGARRTSAWLAVAALAVNLVGVPLRYPGRLSNSIDGYWRHAETLAGLDPPLTAQDRVFIVSDVTTLRTLELMQKTATVMQISDIHDYEALLGVPHTEFITMLYHGMTVSSLEEVRTDQRVTGGFRARLLDVAGVRYVLTPPTDVIRGYGLDLPEVPVDDSRLYVYRNDRALPRARYVPRIEVIEDPGTLLARLAYGDDDLTSVAFVNEPMPSGFTGSSAPPGAGAVRIVRDAAEDIVLDVVAPERGFVVLADQDYPGWEATVNGAPVPIHRANHMFRLVEVPAGASRVEFRYRPRSLAVGAAISLLGLIVAGGLLFWRGRRR